MELKNYFAQDEKGNSLPNATCYLYLAGTPTLAAGLKNATGGDLPNPFVADSSGLIQFAAPNGRYDLRVVKQARDYRIRVQCTDIAESMAVVAEAIAAAQVAAGDAQDAAEELTGATSVIPAANKVPRADADGKIDMGWLSGVLASQTQLDEVAEGLGQAAAEIDGLSIDVESLKNDRMKMLADYSALRSYSGDVKSVRLTKYRIAGRFNIIAGSAATDNGATVIVDALGRVWMREFSNAVDPWWWGPVGDGVADDSDAFLAAMAYANSIAGSLGTADFLIPAGGVFGLSKVLRPTTNVNIKATGWIKCLGNPGDGFDCLVVPVNGASDVNIIGLKVDLNNIPAMNGWMFRTGNANCSCLNFHIKNGKHAKGGTQGGRGFNLESNVTSLPNRGCRVIGGRIENCYMGFAIQGGDQNNRNGFIISDISVDSCDVLFWAVGNTAGYPHDPEEMQGSISNITGRNVGLNTQYSGQGGAIAMDRCSNMQFNNVSIFNGADYGSIEAVVRGNCSNTRMDVTFMGNALSAVSFSPYKESDSVVASENSVVSSDIRITVHGTVADFIKNTTVTADYVTKTNVSGSATSITSGRAVPANFIGLSGLHVDIKDRTANAQISGNADAVSATLFTAFPNRKIDLDIARSGPLEIVDLVTVRGFQPRFKMLDLSASSKDFIIQSDANVWSVLTDVTVDSGLADRKLLEINDATGKGNLYSAGLAVFGWGAKTVSLPRVENYTNDASAAVGGLAIGDVYRNGNVLQVRIA